MMVLNPDPTCSAEARQALQELTARHRAPKCAVRMWTELLTENERQQLGGDLEAIYGELGIADIWRRIRGGSFERALLVLGLGLGFLKETRYLWLRREIGEETTQAELDRDEAVATGGLVIQLLPWEAYWAGEAIDIDWNNCNVLWEFLTGLARATKQGWPLMPEIADDTVTRKTLTNRKSRLTRKVSFPASLKELIESVGDGGYRLRLDPRQIHILF